MPFVCVFWSGWLDEVLRAENQTGPPRSLRRYDVIFQDIGDRCAHRVAVALPDFLLEQDNFNFFLQKTIEMIAELGAANAQRLPNGAH